MPKKTFPKPIKRAKIDWMGDMCVVFTDGTFECEGPFTNLKSGL